MKSLPSTDFPCFVDMHIGLYIGNNLFLRFAKNSIEKYEITKYAMKTEITLFDKVNVSKAHL